MKELEFLFMLAGIPTFMEHYGILRPRMSNGWGCLIPSSANIIPYPSSHVKNFFNSLLRPDLGRFASAPLDFVKQKIGKVAVAEKSKFSQTSPFQLSQQLSLRMIGWGRRKPFRKSPDSPALGLGLSHQAEVRKRSALEALCGFPRASIG